jgi:hypothetical protein
MNNYSRTVWRRMAHTAWIVVAMILIAWAVEQCGGKAKVQGRRVLLSGRTCLLGNAPTSLMPGREVLLPEGVINRLHDTVQFTALGTIKFIANERVAQQGEQVLVSQDVLPALAPVSSNFTWRHWSWLFSSAASRASIACIRALSPYGAAGSAATEVTRGSDNRTNFLLVASARKSANGSPERVSGPVPITNHSGLMSGMALSIFNMVSECNPLRSLRARPIKPTLKPASTVRLLLFSL